MRLRKPINIRTYFRAIVAVAMMLVWSLVTISGFVLWSVPHGPRSGAQILLLNLTKREWGELHVWFSVIANWHHIRPSGHRLARPMRLCEVPRQRASSLGAPANDQPVNSTPVREVA
jgi:hypothetical protein